MQFSDVGMDYCLASNAPWIFTKDLVCLEDIENFQNRFQYVMRRLFDRLRNNVNLSHNAVIAPELGLMTIAEAMLIWACKQNDTKKRRELKITSKRKASSEALMKHKQREHENYLARKARRKEAQAQGRNLCMTMASTFS